MENVEINDLFYKNRFPTDGRKILSVILYAPFGLVLAFIRFSILVQAYLLSSFFPESVIKRLFLRAICTVLGIIVQEENKLELDKAVKVFMSNHITYYDHIPLYLVTGCIGLSSAKVSAPLNWGLKDLKIKPGTESAKAKIQNFRGEIESPILIYPEEETTSGSVGLLKFSPWYGFVSSTVQPVCLKLWRPPFIDISPNTIESSPLSDLLWFLFSPLNVFTIKYSPVITKTSGETDESFMGRIEDAVGNGLNIKKTAYTASDKFEYQKRLSTELRRTTVTPVNRSPSYASSRTSYNLRLIDDRQEQMVEKVSEVLPHVPINVILKDLKKTKSVDLTISNLLEGIVPYTPIIMVQDRPVDISRVEPKPSVSVTDSQKILPVQEPNYTFSKSATERMLTLAERKKRMIDAARKKYIEKIDLKKDS